MFQTGTIIPQLCVNKKHSFVVALPLACFPAMAKRSFYGPQASFTVTEILWRDTKCFEFTPNGRTTHLQHACHRRYIPVAQLSSSNECFSLHIV